MFTIIVIVYLEKIKCPLSHFPGDICHMKLNEESEWGDYAAHTQVTVFPKIILVAYLKKERPGNPDLSIGPFK
jgi:hypothetical protein